MLIKNTLYIRTNIIQAHGRPPILYSQSNYAGATTFFPPVLSLSCLCRKISLIVKVCHSFHVSHSLFSHCQASLDSFLFSTSTPLARRYARDRRQRLLRRTAQGWEEGFKQFICSLALSLQPLPEKKKKTMRRESRSRWAWAARHVSRREFYQEGKRGQLQGDNEQQREGRRGTCCCLWLPLHLKITLTPNNTKAPNSSLAFLELEAKIAAAAARTKPGMTSMAACGNVTALRSNSCFCFFICSNSRPEPRYTGEWCVQKMLGRIKSAFGSLRTAHWNSVRLLRRGRKGGRVLSEIRSQEPPTVITA